MRLASAGLALRSRPGWHSLEQLCSRQSQRRRVQTAVQPAAGRGGASSSRGGSGGGSQLRRKQVDFVLPNQDMLRMDNVTQSDLDTIVARFGAVGFERDSGRCSQRLEDLPEGGMVRLVVPRKPVAATQVSNLQRGLDTSNRSKELPLATFLGDLASSEAPGARLTTLQTSPFTDTSGQEYLQLDAGVVVRSTAYVGELVDELGEPDVAHLAITAAKIRAALRGGESPDLASARRGVTHFKLFLCWEAVRPGLAVDELAKLAALVRVSLVLPSGQALGLASEPAPAVSL